MIEAKNSRAQRFTWDLKEDAWRDVGHLRLIDAFRERRRTSAERVVELGLAERVRDPRQNPATADVESGLSE